MSAPAAPRPQQPIVEGLAFHPDGTLVTTSEDAHARLRRKGFSVSAAQSMSKCPASWAGTPFVPETSLAFGMNTLGTGAHEALELLYQLPPAERTLDALHAYVDQVAATTWADPRNAHWKHADHPGPDLAQLEGVNPALPHLIPHPAEGHISQWRAIVRFLAEGDFALEDPTAVNVHATELQVRGLVIQNGVPLNGAFDRTDIEPDGSYSITDYKGGRYRPHNPRYGGRDEKADQVRIYAAGTAVALDVPLPTKGRLLFVGARHTQHVDLAPSEIDAALDWHLGEWNNYQRHHAAAAFPATPNALCGWCRLANACPVARLTSDKAKRHAATLLPGDALGIPILDAPPTVPLDTDPAPAPSGPASERTEPAPHTPDQPEHTPDTAPRIGERSTDLPGRTPNMTTAPATVAKPTPPRPEGRPYEELVPGPGGEMMLNFNSYAAINAFIIAELATDHLRQHATGATIQDCRALAHVLADTLHRLQSRIANSTGWNDGISSRITRSLEYALRAHPAPVGSTDVQAWAAWTERVHDESLELARTAVLTHLAQPGDIREPIAALAASPMHARTSLD